MLIDLSNRKTTSNMTTFPKKKSVKQNDYPPIIEHQIDDEVYRVGDHDQELVSNISTNGDSMKLLSLRKSRSITKKSLAAEHGRRLIEHLTRFALDTRQKLTRSQSATDATRILRNNNTRNICTLAKYDPLYEQSNENSDYLTRKRHKTTVEVIDDLNGTDSVYIRSSSEPRDFTYSKSSRRRSQRSLPLLSRSASMHDLTQHTVFRANDLEFGPIIGQGFYGIARTVTLRKTGQIMVMKETKTLDKDAQKIFVKEVQVLKRLIHPNVLKFMGLLLDKDNQMSFLVAGGTLKNIIHDLSMDLTWIQRLRFAKDIAAGMNGQVVVADFGLSRINLDDEEDEEQQNEITLKNQRSTSVTVLTNGNVVVRPKTRRQMLRDRQRYTVVGSPYWMAPEMLKGQCYDERVDIFSFGIMLCEIIGRVQADPDYLPRTQDFGLNVHLFSQKYCNKDCPKQFVAIAIACCDINPNSRPAFCVAHPWLEALALSVETGVSLSTTISNIDSNNIEQNRKKNNNSCSSVLVSNSTLDNVPLR
ncbi:unnamed protein product [Didymodactylos carnosus]|uniref:Protein kinase domain-containing protein n=1 Tax=Didymodactylos carnosus TaxID=1234261 RepID=A0A814E7J9_9BILA|nr:unnamed protein product [Didymodactylos carnosus]CAF0986024.1 unnamed protein product [Didymodactylos carnosus]CAF3737950.1 unnamed protein product [Didymodactylos carnosus]CAF3756346.1 unnamed protein product [Didymodactylos carnosus]